MRFANSLICNENILVINQTMDLLCVHALCSCERLWIYSHRLGIKIWFSCVFPNVPNYCQNTVGSLVTFLASNIFFLCIFLMCRISAKLLLQTFHISYIKLNIYFSCYFTLCQIIAEFVLKKLSDYTGLTLSID